MKPDKKKNIIDYLLDVFVLLSSFERVFLMISIPLVLSFLLFCLSLALEPLYDFFIDKNVDLYLKVAIILGVLCLIFLLFLIVTGFGLRKIKKSGILEIPEAEIAAKLMRYNKQRAEIEEEIARLSKEISNSTAANFIDINRLVYSGQTSNKSTISSNCVNYDSFISQFGIDIFNIKQREKSAVFLTPFNKNGEILFRQCQHILTDLDIFLQRTDNHVEKKDIMMNIVNQIVRAEFIIANLNDRNPNVYYELGIAQAIGKPTILIAESRYGDSPEAAAFDLAHNYIIMYENEASLEKQLYQQVTRLYSSKTSQ